MAGQGESMIVIEPAVEAFLDQTLVAVISTIDRAGRPRTAPIWFHWEDGAAYMFTARSSLKWRNIQRYPYASLCVDWREPPYPINNRGWTDRGSRKIALRTCTWDGTQIFRKGKRN